LPVLTGCWALVRPRKAKLASVLGRILIHYCCTIEEGKRVTGVEGKKDFCMGQEDKYIQA